LKDPTYRTRIVGAFPPK